MAVSWLFEKLTIKSKKVKVKYMHGELNTWKEHNRMNFHGY